jgi:cytidyltransferase-like protein
MITTFDQLDQCRQGAPGSKIVLVLGCFDLLHPGHGEALTYAKSLGDLLVVGVWSDLFVSANKGPGRPVNSAEQRAEMLDFLGSTDACFVVPAQYTARTVGVEAVLDRLKPDVYMIGGELTFPAGRFTTASGWELTIVEDPNYSRKATSTSTIIASILT